MTNPTNGHREQAREIVSPFALTFKRLDPAGQSASVERLVQRIAAALSSRDAEVREVLEGLITKHPQFVGELPCWCRSALNLSITGAHDDNCLQVQALYTKLQPKQ